MFPMQEERIKFDEYGELIQPEDYRIAELSSETQDENKENNLIKSEDIKKEKEGNFFNGFIFKCLNLKNPL